MVNITVDRPSRRTEKPRPPAPCVALSIKPCEAVDAAAMTATATPSQVARVPARSVVAGRMASSRWARAAVSRRAAGPMRARSANDETISYLPSIRAVH